MPKVPSQVEFLPVTILLQPVINLTDDQLFALCQQNRELRMERTAQGELLIMPPTGGETSDRNAELTMQLRLWAKHEQTGIAFDSSGGFLLPNGAMRSPDAAWVRRARLTNLTQEQKQKFLALCPDFVIELRSPADRLSTLQAKMEEYIQNGAALGWLIDPQDRRVCIYRPERPVEWLENPTTLSGDAVLVGFVLNLQEIWQPAL
jgi:Uma2 family endonuclease